VEIRNDARIFRQSFGDRHTNNIMDIITRNEHSKQVVLPIHVYKITLFEMVHDRITKLVRILDFVEPECEIHSSVPSLNVVLVSEWIDRPNRFLSRRIEIGADRILFLLSLHEYRDA
jgi:hypothetical protein